MSGIDIHRVRLSFTRKSSVLPELRTPSSLSCAPNYPSPLPINYIVKYPWNTTRARDLSATVKRDADADRCDAGSRDYGSRVFTREEEREDVILRSRFTGHWGEVTSVAVAAAMSELRRAHTSHARLARGATRRRRRRVLDVLVDTIANDTDTLIERCVSTRKESNLRGLGLYEQAYSARKLLDKFRIIKFVYETLLLSSVLSCSPPLTLKGRMLHTCTTFTLKLNSA